MSFIEEILAPDGRLSHKFGMGKYVTLLEKAIAKREGYKFCCVYGAGSFGMLTFMISESGLPESFLDSLFSRVFKTLGLPVGWAICVNDKETWKVFKQIGAQGYDFDGDNELMVSMLGTNWRLPELEAAVIYHLEFGK